MNNKSIRWVLVVGIILILAACTGANEPPPPIDTLVPTAVKATEASTSEESEPEPASIDAANLFQDNCSRCHGDERQGKNGPSLLPERLTKDASVYEKTITNGSGPMPAWGNRLSAEEIKALAEWILTPVE
ncbi:MAG: cytochrome c [Anaerolineales bacterium]|nr:cytochrome c [Anaerolineales bacterium]